MFFSSQVGSSLCDALVSLLSISGSVYGKPGRRQAIALQLQLQLQAAVLRSHRHAAAAALPFG